MILGVLADSTSDSEPWKFIVRKDAAFLFRFIYVFVNYITAALCIRVYSLTGLAYTNV